jgi:hypothetical protein
MKPLRDPKMEKFSQALLSNIAAGMPRSKAAHEAGLAAGYTGKSLASNSRKRAQRKDVKARMAELAAPAIEKAQESITATLDWAVDKLVRIAAPDLGDGAVRTPDQIAAIKLLAEIKGWKAPEKVAMEPLRIERIERVVIDSQNRDSSSLRTIADPVAL